MWLDRFRSAPARTESVDLPVTITARATRFHLDVVVSFVEDDRTYTGQCINVSQSGLLARFDNAPEPWSEGKVELETKEHYLNIHARVARRQGNEVGFAFSLKTENDRAGISILIQAVSHCPLPEPADLDRIGPAA